MKKITIAKPRARFQPGRWWFYLAAVAVVAGIYLRFLNLHAPLSYDEGYWAYITARLLAGDVPYREVIVINLPWLFVPYALTETLLGPGIFNLRLGGIIWNIGAIYLSSLIGRQVFGKAVGWMVAALLAIYSMAPQQEGMFLLLGEQLGQLPLAAAGLAMIYAMSRLKKTWPFVLSGILVGISWGIREHYILLQLAFTGFLLWQRRNGIVSWSQVIAFLVGSLIPLGAAILFFARHHQVANFIDFTMKQRFAYAIYDWGELKIPRVGFSLGWKISNLWLVGLLSLGSLPVLRKNWQQPATAIVILLSITQIAALASTGNRFIGHYFLYATYGLVIPAAVGLASGWEKLIVHKPSLGWVVVAIMLITLWRQFSVTARYLLQFSNPNISRGVMFGKLTPNLQLIDYLNRAAPLGRVMFIGEAVPHYYYLGRNALELNPMSIYYPHYNRYQFEKWFDDFKQHPAKFIVTDYGIPDIMLIDAFRDYANDHYKFDQQINQHYIYTLTN